METAIPIARHPKFATNFHARAVGSPAPGGHEVIDFYEWLIREGRVPTLRGRVVINAFWNAGLRLQTAGRRGSPGTCCSAEAAPAGR